MIDTSIAICSAVQMAKNIENLKSERTPLPYGIYCKYKAFIPKRSPVEIYENESDHYWHWYAAELDNFISVLETTPRMEFVDKKKRSN